MECDRYFPSVPFVMLTVDQCVGRGGGPLERQDSHDMFRQFFCYLQFWFVQSTRRKGEEPIATPSIWT